MSDLISALACSGTTYLATHYVSKREPIHPDEFRMKDGILKEGTSYLANKFSLEIPATQAFLYSQISQISFFILKSLPFTSLLADFALIEFYRRNGVSLNLTFAYRGISSLSYFPIYLVNAFNGLRIELSESASISREQDSAAKSKRLKIVLRMVVRCFASVLMAYPVCRYLSKDSKKIVPLIVLSGTSDVIHSFLNLYFPLRQLEIYSNLTPAISQFSRVAFSHNQGNTLLETATYISIADFISSIASNVLFKIGL